MITPAEVSDWTIVKADGLLNLISLIPKPLIFLIAFLIITVCVNGNKFKSFVNPYHPKRSLLIREAACLIVPLSFLITYILLVYFLLIFVLVLISNITYEQLDSYTYDSIFFLTAKQILLAKNSAASNLLYGFGFGLPFSAYLKFYQLSKWERGLRIDSVEDTIKSLSKLYGFNPLKYIDIKKGCFIGLDINKKPIYINWDKLRETHIQILGQTGCGKGTVMTLIAYQCILAGEGLTWFDPKDDSHSQALLAYAAELAGKDFYLINLRQDQPPQLNPIACASASEIEDLLVASFDLKAKDTDGDFHRGRDQDAAILASKIAIEKNAMSIPELIEASKAYEVITNQENFWRKFIKLSELSAINTKDGLNLSEAISNQAVIYIIGETESERVKMLQRLLLVRINQIIKKEDRFNSRKFNCVVLDEFKHMLSQTALTSLAVIRDFNTHYLLAHQSLGDLDMCAGVTRAEAEGAVLDNTAIKIIFKIGDSGYAEKMSKNSGKKKIFVEQSSKSVNTDDQSHGGWRETYLPVIDADVLMHMPMPKDHDKQASVGALFGVGVAKLFHVGYIPIDASKPAINPAPKYKDTKAFEGSDIYDLI